MIRMGDVGTVARRALMCSAAAWSFACGNAPPPSPSPPASAPAAPPALVAADLAEPTEPSHVVGILRIRNPNVTLETVYRWTGIRLSGSDLAAQFLDSGLAGALSFDSPIDAVAALDPRATTEPPLMAVSVGVRSVDAARRAFQAMGPITEVRPGEFRVTVRQSKKKSEKPACLLLSARGTAPGRVICGRRDHDVDAMRGYMARTLPERDLGPADVHLELHAPPVVDIYAPLINQGLNVGAALARRKLELGEPTFDRALGATATGLSEELRALLADLDTLTVDVAVAPERANASVVFRLKGQQSWTAGTLSAQAARADAAPTMFWSLPATATAASYTYPPEHQRFDAIRHTLGELLDGFLGHEGLAPADRAPLVAIFDDKYANDSPWVTASGRFERDAAKPAAKTSTSAPADPLQAAVDGFGWYMAGVATPNQTPDLVKTLATAVSRPKLQSLLRSKLAELLTASDAPSDEAGFLPSGITFKPAAAPKELPRGSLAFELMVTRDAPHGAGATKKPPAKPAAPVKLHVIVVPESARTWVILGSDKAHVVKTVLAATEGAPLAAKVASRSDLAALKDGKYAGAGFSTLQSHFESWFGSAARMPLDPDKLRMMAEARTSLESTPNRGKTPILFTNNVNLENGITWRVAFDVPKGVIEDAIVLAASSRLMLPTP
ncbi:MAG TPA: hypothetical protein VK550_34690 [Polyangiaceae bacterium]|nr:hypothetical protein [Polyangiaceae bacterium]